jgi:hypothetical protein
VDKKVSVLERRVDAQRDFNRLTNVKVEQQDIALQEVRLRVEKTEGALRGADGKLINVASAIAEMKGSYQRTPSSNAPSNSGGSSKVRPQGPGFELRDLISPLIPRREPLAQAPVPNPPPPVQPGAETIDRIARLEQEVNRISPLADGALRKYEVELMPNSGDGWLRKRIYSQKRGLWYLWVWSPSSAPILRVFEPRVRCVNGNWEGAWVLLDLSKYPLPSDFPRADSTYEAVPGPGPTLLPGPEPINPSSYQAGRVAQK